MTDSKAKNNVKISRRRVNELVALRLETLTKKQRLRRPAVRLTPAKAARLADLTASIEAQRKKESLSTQTQALAKSICVWACTRLRPSFGEEADWAGMRRLVAQGSVIGELPPRTRETGPCLRTLDRSEARLLRLVQAWALTEARKEQEAQREAESCPDGH